MRRLLIIFLILLPTLVFGQNFKPVMGTQINWAHPAADGLVGAWFELEGSGNKVFDLSGNENTGIFGAGNDSPIWVPGKSGSAISFDGNGDYADLGTNPVFDFGANNFTISAWLYPRSLSDFDGVICKDNNRGSAYSWLFTIHSSGELQFHDGGGWQVSATASVTVNKWNHVVWVIKNGTCYYYLNGIAHDSDTFNNNDIISHNVYLGSWHSAVTAYTLDGLIDHISIYNRALSSTEIALLYREPFCMFQKDNVAMMTVEAPAAAPGQVITIQMSILTPLIICAFVGLIRGREWK